LTFQIRFAAQQFQLRIKTEAAAKRLACQRATAAIAAGCTSAGLGEIAEDDPLQRAGRFAKRPAVVATAMPAAFGAGNP